MWKDLASELAQELEGYGALWTSAEDGSIREELHWTESRGHVLRDTPVTIHRGWMSDKDFDIEDPEALAREAARLTSLRDLRIADERRRQVLKPTIDQRRKQFLLARMRRRAANQRCCKVCRKPFALEDSQYERRQVCSKTCEYRREDRHRREQKYRERKAKGSPQRCGFCLHTFFSKPGLRHQRFCTKEHASMFVKDTRRRRRHQSVIARSCKVCIVCEGPFEHIVRADKRFCSDRCLRWFRRRSKVLKLPARACAWCSAIFKPKLKKQIFCCKEHSVLADLQRRKERKHGRQTLSRAA